MPVPAWILAAGALGAGYLLFGEKKASAAIKPGVKTAAKPVIPVSSSKTDIVPIPITTKGTLGDVSQSVMDDMTKSGAVHIETQATGAQVFRKPDGGTVTVIPDVTITAGKASNSAFVNTARDPLNVRAKPDSNAAKLGTVAKDSAVQILGKIVSGPGSKKGWAPIQKPGTTLTGYVAVDYLRDIDIDPELQA